MGILENLSINGKDEFFGEIGRKAASRKMDAGWNNILVRRKGEMETTRQMDKGRRTKTDRT